MSRQPKITDIPHQRSKRPRHRHPLHPEREMTLEEALEKHQRQTDEHFQRCFLCEQPIDPQNKNSTCIVRIVDDDGNLVRDKDDGHTCIAALCLRCGRNVGGWTIAELDEMGWDTRIQ